MNEALHLVARQRRTAAEMADYSSVAPPSSNAGGGMNDAFKDALQRARQVRSTIWAKKLYKYYELPGEVTDFR